MSNAELMKVQYLLRACANAAVRSAHVEERVSNASGDVGAVSEWMEARLITVNLILNLVKDIQSDDENVLREITLIRNLVLKRRKERHARKNTLRAA